MRWHTVGDDRSSGETTTTTDRHGTQDHGVRADAYLVLDSRIADVASSVVIDAIAPSKSYSMKQGNVLADARAGANHETPAVIDGQPGADYGAAR